MDFQCYIAMTAAEYFSAEKLPESIAWMACHFSCYGAGLSNLPPELPENSMVIINDRLPPNGHDPQYIVKQIQVFQEFAKPFCILLDFQREGSAETAEIAKQISAAADCIVGISEYYADCGNGPVFIGTPKPHETLFDVISPWDHREIWLEAALEKERAIINYDSSQILPIPYTESIRTDMINSELCCRYSIIPHKDHVELTYERDLAQLELLIRDAKEAGIQTAIGLYQQLGNRFMHKQ